MTASAGASLGQINNANWSEIDWEAVEQFVKRLQMRIAKAFGEKRFNKAKALQRLLTSSYYAKLFAVRRVSINKGKNTPGVDGVIWKTAKDKLAAALALKRFGYNPLPLRRIYIPKKNGQKRPLGIPSMHERAFQALHLLALAPISEMLADPDSYGFRPYRSCADAIEQCFNSLSRRSAPKWILEGDIKSCFDKIDHKWLLQNMPMDVKILNKWLKAGYIEKATFVPTLEGTPQGGIISPTLLNLTLSGLQKAIQSKVTRADNVNVIIYADDFVVTGASQEVLEKVVKPTVEEFLKVRGLELSIEKTKITHIREGFDFLGFNVRKYGEKLLIKPSKSSIISFCRKFRAEVKARPAGKTEYLIGILNPKIRGWANYYRLSVAKKSFSYIDSRIFRMIWNWCKRRHPMKPAYWLRKKYFRSCGFRTWQFSTTKVIQLNTREDCDLIFMSDTKIQRHIKIKKHANPFKPEFTEYFKKRKRNKVHEGQSKLMDKCTLDVF